MPATDAPLLDNTNAQVAPTGVLPSVVPPEVPPEGLTQEQMQQTIQQMQQQLDANSKALSALTSKSSQAFAQTEPFAALSAAAAPPEITQEPPQVHRQPRKRLGPGLDCAFCHAPTNGSGAVQEDMAEGTVNAGADRASAAFPSWDIPQYEGNAMKSAAVAAGAAAVSAVAAVAAAPVASAVFAGMAAVAAVDAARLDIGSVAAEKEKASLEAAEQRLTILQDLLAEGLITESDFVKQTAIILQDPASQAADAQVAGPPPSASTTLYLAAASAAERGAKVRDRTADEIKDFVDVTAAKISAQVRPTSGLKWEEMRWDERQLGSEIQSSELAAALQHKVEFTQDEFDLFRNVSDLSYKSYIEVGDKTFRPAGSTGSKRVFMYSMWRNFWSLE